MSTPDGRSDPALAQRTGSGRRRLGSAILLVIGLLLVPGPALAQQWWWNGSARASGSSERVEVDGDEVSKYDTQSLDLLFVVNGYLYHRAIGSFSLGVGSLLSRADGEPFDSVRSFASVELLPLSMVPTTIYANHKIYTDTGDLYGDFPAPETETQFGASSFVAWGPLKGLRFGAERSEVGYSDGALDRSDDQFVYWTRGSRRFEHEVTLDRERDEVESRGLILDDLSLGLTETIELGPWVSWELTGDSFRRQLETEKRTLQYDILGLRSRLDWDADGIGRFAFIAGTWESDYLASRYLGASHVLALGERWSVVSDLDYTVQDADETQARAPRATVRVGYRRDEGRIDWTILGGVNAGRFDVDGPTTQKQSFLGFWVDSQIQWGELDRLEVMARAAYLGNQVRQSDVLIEDLPDLGTAGGVGTQNELQAELRLRRHAPPIRLESRTLLSLRESATVSNLDFSSSTADSRLTVGWGRFSLAADFGSAVAESTSRQTSTYWGLQGTYQAFRFLSLFGDYRAVSSNVDVLGDYETRWTHLGVTSTFGQWYGQLALRREEIVNEDGTQRLTDAITWNIGRGFSGRLPIFTGPRRRGFVR